MMRKVSGLLSVSLVLALVVTIMLLFDLFKSEDVLFMLLSLCFLALSVFYTNRWFGKCALWIALALLFMFVFTRPNFWLLVLIVILSVSWLWWGVLKNMHQKYDTLSLHVTEPTQEKYGRVQKAYWLQERQMIAQNYEWDDIHLVSWFGDTTIHLGHTILPEGTSIIVIHKALGDVRIIVPLGIGVSLSHSTLRGHVLFEHEHYCLGNEQLSVYSENYTVAKRCIKIVTTVYIGNLEVIQI